MGKHCPYCGRRISYFSTFYEKKRGLHTCTRCKKESKIKTDFRLIIAFIAVILIVLMFMIMWYGSGNYNNFLGVIITAAILTIFYFMTPLFIRFVPLKKYREQDSSYPEEYEYEYDYDNVPEADEDDFSKTFTFNKDIFEQIKEKRHSTIAKNNTEPEEDIGHTKVADKNYVPIIKDVTEAHASSSNEPLRKVKTPSRSHYDYESRDNFDDEAPVYIPRRERKQEEKPNGSKYTANRKF